MNALPLEPVINSLQSLTPKDFSHASELKNESAEAIQFFTDSLIDVVLAANLTFVPNAT